MRKAPPRVSSVDEYIAAAPTRFRGELRRIRRAVRAAAPGASEVISYGMPAFRDGRILVYFGAFSEHVSLFVASPVVRRAFAKELRPFLGGKGTIRFTPEHPLPFGLLARILRARVAENSEKGPSRAAARGDPVSGSARPNRSPDRRAAR